jgi:hypothetical protein
MLFAWYRAVAMRKERLSGSAAVQSEATTVALHEPAVRQEPPAYARPPRSWRSRRRAAKAARAARTATVRNDAGSAEQTTTERPSGARQPTVHPRSSAGQAEADRGSGAASGNTPARTKPLPTRVLSRDDRTDVEQPGFHLYRPSGERPDDPTDE